MFELFGPEWTSLSKKGVPVKSAKYDKSTLYEKMLPSIALVVVKLDE